VLGDEVEGVDGEEGDAQTPSGGDQNTRKAAKHDSVRAADLEKVTDYVEEKEMHSEQLSDAMRLVNDRITEEVNVKRLKEIELASVKINKEDIDLIVHEMEIPRTAAERALREHKGSVFDALVALSN